MSKTAVITASIDDATRADLERLAERFGCSVDHLVTTAVLRFIDDESEASADEFSGLPPYVDPDPLARNLNEANANAIEAFRAYVQPALDDIEAGRTIPHEEVFRRMTERHRSRDAA